MTRRGYRAAKKALLLAVVVSALASAPASAGPVLHAPAARHVIWLWFAKDGEASNYRIKRCERLRPRLIYCWTAAYDVAWEGAGVGTLKLGLKVRRVPDFLILTSPLLKGELLTVHAPFAS